MSLELPVGFYSPIRPLPLRYFPDKILSKRSEPIPMDEEPVRNLVRDLAHCMVLTMMVEGGIGLAAPQIGELIRLFVVDLDWAGETREGLEYTPIPEEIPDRVRPGSNTYVFINPEIISRQGDIGSMEGCLSFPGEKVTGVRRASTIDVKALDTDGKEFTLHAEGLLAIAIQHEYDHLEGKTLGDRMGEMSKLLVRKRAQKKQLKAARASR